MLDIKHLEVGGKDVVNEYPQDAPDIWSMWV